MRIAPAKKSIIGKEKKTNKRINSYMLSHARLAISATVCVLVAAAGVIFLQVPTRAPSNSAAGTEVGSSTSQIVTLGQQTTLSVVHSIKSPDQSGVVNITSIAVTKTGPIGKLLLISAPALNSTYPAGNSIALNFSIAFANIGDEGYIQYNSSASLANVSISTPGFRLQNVIVMHNPNENPIFLPMQNFVHATFVVKLPSYNYSGPLTFHFDAQPTGQPVYGINPGF